MTVSAVIYITYRCNYFCPYCHSYNKDDPVGYRESMEKEIEAKYWIDFVNRFRNEKAIWDLTGGEPTLYKGILELLNAVPERHKVAITTNLSLPLKDLVPILSHRRIFHITCSWHPSQTNDVSSFIGKIHSIRTLGKGISVNYVAYRDDTTDQISNIPTYKQLFEQNGIPFHVDPYQGSRFIWTKEYIDKVRGYVTDRNLGEARVIPSMKPCKAGWKYFVATPSGNIWRCTYFMFNDLKEGYLGNIKEGTFNPLLKPTDCPRDICSAGCDIDGIRKVG